MKAGDLCYIPQGVTLYTLNAQGTPSDFLRTQKPITAVILHEKQDAPKAQQLYKLQVLVHGRKWQVLKRDIYQIEEQYAY
jgi:uncharacterized RmlC-like cupin family protein